MDIEQLRTFCLSLPVVTEDIKWDNDLVFSVGGKMFCVASLDPPLKCSFKVKDEEFDELIAKTGYFPAPYLARAKWVLITDAVKFSKGEWQNYIVQSYELVKGKLPKRVRNELGFGKY